VGILLGGCMTVRN